MSALLAEYSSFILISIQGLFAWTMWSLRKSFVRIENYNKDMTKEYKERFLLDTRLSSLETKVKSMPDAEHIAELTSVVESLRGDIKAMEMRISGLDRLLERVERVVDRFDLQRRNYA